MLIDYWIEFFQKVLKIRGIYENIRFLKLFRFSMYSWSTHQFDLFPSGFLMWTLKFYPLFDGKNFNVPNGTDPENKFFDPHEMVIPNIYNLWWFVPKKFPENRWRENFLMNYSVEHTFSDLFYWKTKNSKIPDHNLLIEQTIIMIK